MMQFLAANGQIWKAEKPLKLFYLPEGKKNDKTLITNQLRTTY